MSNFEHDHLEHDRMMTAPNAQAMLGSCSGYARVMLGQCSGHARVMLGPCSGHAPIVLHKILQNISENTEI